MHASRLFGKGINAEEEDRKDFSSSERCYLISHMQLTSDGEHVSILSSPGFPTGRGRIYWRARRHEILVS